MKTICATLFLLGFVSLPLLAQTAVSKAKPSTPVEQEIIELERQWAAVIKSQDISAASRLLSEDYFLAIGVQGAPLQIFPRKVWLETLKFYVTESYSIDDIKVHIHGDTGGGRHALYAKGYNERSRSQRTVRNYRYLGEAEGRLACGRAPLKQT